MSLQPKLHSLLVATGLLALSLMMSAAEDDPSALDRWSVRFTSSETYLFGVTSGTNGLVAVGSGSFLTSKEGTDWAQADQAGGVRSVAFGAGTYVAVGNGGNILTSPDGIVWSNRNSHTVGELTDVAYGGGRFVAVAFDGAVRTSLDSGVTWLTSTSGVSRLWGIAYGSDRFVAVGSEGNVLVSTNGMDWLSASNSSSASLFKVAFGDGKFVAVGSERTVLTSLDGFTWTPVLLPPGIPPPLEEIIYANGTFVGGGQLGVLMSSSNGVDWTYRQLPTRPIAYSIRGLAFDGESFVAVGFSQGSVVLQSDPVQSRRPKIARAPRDTAVRLGSSANLNVAAHGTSPLTYRWQREGIDLPGETNSSISFSNTPFSAEAFYTVAIDNALGSVTSAPVRLRVGTVPTIVLQPQNQEVAPGGMATFSIQVAGTPPFEFRWRQPGSIYSTRHDSGWQSFWSVDAAAPIHAGSYGVIVSNEFGSAISRGAQLTLLADWDGDGLPDSWEFQHGLATNEFTDATLDLDGDGMNNLDEYHAGTIPTDADSRLSIRAILDGERATIEFQGESNRTYTVQFKDTVDSTAWHKLVDLAAQTNQHTISVPDPSSMPKRFYRVVTPHQP